MRRRDDHTGDMFVVPTALAPADGAMDFRQSVSHFTSEVLHDAGQDRFHVAADMSRLTGKSVTKLMLDGYTSEARETFNLPLYLVPSLETACSSTRLTEWLAGTRGGQLCVGADTIDAEIGRIEHQQQLKAQQLKDLRALRRRVR